MGIKVQVHLEQRPTYDYENDRKPINISKDNDVVILKEEGEISNIRLDFYDLKQALDKLENL